MFEPDRYLAADRAKDALVSSTGQDLGDELQLWSEVLAYRAARDYAEALRRIESQLVNAALSDWTASDRVHEHALDVIRRRMVRGLYRAQLEAGDSAVFWRSR